MRLFLNTGLKDEGFTATIRLIFRMNILDFPCSIEQLQISPGGFLDKTGQLISGVGRSKTNATADFGFI